MLLQRDGPSGIILEVDLKKHPLQRSAMLELRAALLVYTGMMVASKFPVGKIPRTGAAKALHHPVFVDRHASFMGRAHPTVDNRRFAARLRIPRARAHHCKIFPRHCSLNKFQCLYGKADCGSLASRGGITSNCFK